LLGWSQQELADFAILSVDPIKKYEKHGTGVRRSTVDQVESALERAGIEFIENGVRKKKDKVIIHEGPDAIARLFDDIILTLKELPLSERNLDIFGVDEEVFLRNCDLEKLEEHIEQRKYFSIKQRILLKAGDTNFVGSSRTYRWMPEEYFSITPTFVYGHKVATILWEIPPEVIIISNELFSQERRRNFEMAWNAAEIPHKPETTTNGRK